MMTDISEKQIRTYEQIRCRGAFSMGDVSRVVTASAGTLKRDDVITILKHYGALMDKHNVQRGDA